MAISATRVKYLDKENKILVQKFEDITSNSILSNIVTPLLDFDLFGQLNQLMELQNAVMGAFNILRDGNIADFIGPNFLDTLDLTNPAIAALTPTINLIKGLDPDSLNTFMGGLMEDVADSLFDNPSMLNSVKGLTPNLQNQVFLSALQTFSKKVDSGLLTVDKLTGNLTEKISQVTDVVGKVNATADNAVNIATAIADNVAGVADDILQQAEDGLLGMAGVSTQVLSDIASGGPTVDGVMGDVNQTVNAVTVDTIDGVGDTAESLNDQLTGFASLSPMENRPSNPSVSLASIQFNPAELSVVTEVPSSAIENIKNAFTKLGVSKKTYNPNLPVYSNVAISNTQFGHGGVGVLAGVSGGGTGDVIGLGNAGIDPIYAQTVFKAFISIRLELFRRLYPTLVNAPDWQDRYPDAVDLRSKLEAAISNTFLGNTVSIAHNADAYFTLIRGVIQDFLQETAQGSETQESLNTRHLTTLQSVVEYMLRHIYMSDLLTDYRYRYLNQDIATVNDYIGQLIADPSAPDPDYSGNTGEFASTLNAFKLHVQAMIDRTTILYFRNYYSSTHFDSVAVPVLFAKLKMLASVLNLRTPFTDTRVTKVKLRVCQELFSSLFTEEVRSEVSLYGLQIGDKLVKYELQSELASNIYNLLRCYDKMFKTFDTRDLSGLPVHTAILFASHASIKTRLNTSAEYDNTQSLLDVLVGFDRPSYKEVQNDWSVFFECPDLNIKEYSSMELSLSKFKYGGGVVKIA